VRHFSLQIKVLPKALLTTNTLSLPTVITTRHFSPRHLSTKTGSQAENLVFGSNWLRWRVTWWQSIFGKRNVMMTNCLRWKVLLWQLNGDNWHGIDFANCCLARKPTRNTSLRLNRWRIHLRQAQCRGGPSNKFRTGSKNANDKPQSLQRCVCFYKTTVAGLGQKLWWMKCQQIRVINFLISQYGVMPAEHKWIKHFVMCSLESWRVFYQSFISAV